MTINFQILGGVSYSAQNQLLSDLIVASLLSVGDQNLDYATTIFF